MHGVSWRSGPGGGAAPFTCCTSSAAPALRSRVVRKERQRPGQVDGGGLLPRHQQRHQLVAQRPPLHARAALVPRQQQAVQQALRRSREQSHVTILAIVSLSKPWRWTVRHGLTGSAGLYPNLRQHKNRWVQYLHMMCLGCS